MLGDGEVDFESNSVSVPNWIMPPRRVKSAFSLTVENVIQGLSRGAVQAAIFRGTDEEDPADCELHPDF